MSSFRSVAVLLQLLCLASLVLGRPSDSPALNEVNYQEAANEDYMNNDMMQQISAMPSPVVGGAFYKQRRAFYNPGQLWRSSFLRRFYQMPGSNVYPELAISPGGTNYYSNEVLPMPMSTYEIIEPETMF
ncbi:uncharacterized protein [Drosophila virilis]|uniref:Uncharacterized protein n=1 Tax=Drosophila virilis TaxID=7244 RepID=B4LTF9_DROVI|nr:uncharacterized protein LOC6627812 [Drosophila virilis]EDW63929.1 uncharacterized protein Dvir_GJ10499 [Drosophila virilis]